MLIWFLPIPKGQYPDEEEIEEMVDDADEDGSGSINFQEFVGLMLKKQQGGQTREEIKQVLPKYTKKIFPLLDILLQCWSCAKLPNV